MESTDHRVVCDDARRLDTCLDQSVDLVVTSPPYPMIELWDDLFADLNPEIADAIAAGDGDHAFELMHRELDQVWDAIAAVISDGGLVCLNIGDATRSIDGTFQLYPNHARIISAFRDRGFQSLPPIIWHKPTNRLTKFMGSGMIPPNAYVTYEHEHILVFRAGDLRSISDRTARYEAAYFWEERNQWFTDIWTDIGTETQALDTDAANRDRSAAYPLALPLRLIRMFSIYGDTVLDPFVGTGTTTLAALIAGRHSIGVDLDPGILSLLDDRLQMAPDLSRENGRQRLADHAAFVRTADRTFAHDSTQYGFPVTTKQEVDLSLYAVDTIEDLSDERGYRATYTPLTRADID